MERNVTQSNSNRESCRPDRIMQMIEDLKKSKRAMTPEEEAFRDRLLTKKESDGRHGCGAEADGNTGEILMDWNGQDFHITYGVDAHNPDWSFLDDWDLQDIETFYETNAKLPIAHGLAEYLKARRNS